MLRPTIASVFSMAFICACSPSESVSSGPSETISEDLGVASSDIGVTTDAQTDIVMDVGPLDITVLDDTVEVQLDVAVEDSVADVIADSLAVADAAKEVADDTMSPGLDGIQDVSDDVLEIDVPPPPPPFWTLPEGYDQFHIEDLVVGLDGETDDINFVLPDNAMSFTVLISGAPSEVYMRLNKLVSPVGHPLVVSQGDVLCIPCKNRVYANHTLTTSLVPNSPEVKYAPKGKYKFKIRQFTVTMMNGFYLTAPWSGTTVTARVLIKLGDPTQITKGTLDLNMWFHPNAEVNAVNASENPRIIKALKELNEIFLPTGIQVGEVNMFDLPSELPESVTTTLGKDSDLSLLFQTTGQDAPPGINVVFVSSIVKTELKDGSQGVVLGIAGGIPGPPFVAGGTPHSGVAVSWVDTAGENDLLGSTLAHELGHYLGLYHTTEKEKKDEPSANVHDPIADTPEFDKTNLMYWLSAGGLTLTEGQSFVMQRHPSVRLEFESSAVVP